MECATRDVDRGEGGRRVVIFASYVADLCEFLDPLSIPSCTCRLIPRYIYYILLSLFISTEIATTCVYLPRAKQVDSSSKH